MDLERLKDPDVLIYVLVVSFAIEWLAICVIPGICMMLVRWWTMPKGHLEIVNGFGEQLCITPEEGLRGCLVTGLWRPCAHWETQALELAWPMAIAQIQSGGFLEICLTGVEVEKCYRADPRIKEIQEFPVDDFFTLRYCRRKGVLTPK